MLLKTNQGLTIQQLASIEKEHKQSVNGMLQRMKRAGLVTVQPTMKGNRCVSGYFAVIENESGHARDELVVTVSVYVNEFGEYSAKADIRDQSPFRHEGNPTLWHCHQFTLAVPKPTEPARTRTVLNDGLQVVHNNKDIVIEGEIIDIKDK